MAAYDALSNELEDSGIQRTREQASEKNFSGWVIRKRGIVFSQ